LRTLSRLYGRAAQLRRAWYRRHPDRARRLAQPVISVGNLVVGGSGKTPVVAMLARLLLERGEHPAILSRGYGRRRAPEGVVVVSDGRELLEPTPRSGDEPQMLARALPEVPVVVSSDRYLAGGLAERRFGCTLHLLDDGFQHLQLARDIDLLLMSRRDLDERVLPAGRLREPLEAARAANALLVAGTADDVAAVALTTAISAVFRMCPRYGSPRLVEPFGAPLPAPAGQRAVAVAAIARPERFFHALRAEGWDVVREMTFRDHHWFSSRDLDAIRLAARVADADVIITTEKDAMRLLTVGREPNRETGPSVESPIAYLPMDIVIDSADQFAAWLGERVAAARAKRAQEAA
jgi:tetraacyldisaccharide 4'-kinase